MPENPFDNITLGQHQPYVDQYDPTLLQPVPRKLARASLSAVPPFGRDIWTAYELSWLDGEGRPQVAIAQFDVPASSEAIVESKSFKYYLNSFNQTAIPDRSQLRATLTEDLSAAAGGEVGVQLFELEEFNQYRFGAQAQGRCIDQQGVAKQSAQPDKNLLQIDREQPVFDGVLVSHLFKSNCPVTGQPDWASVWLSWHGPALVESSLLSYLVSFRRHQDFHEHCVERIYTDLHLVLQPQRLWVYARYTRRGGLDINPFRSSVDMAAPVLFGARQ